MEEGVTSDLLRAALLGAFDPRQLFDPAAKDGGARLRRLAAMAVEVQVGDQWLWSLTPDARRAGLALLPGPKDRGTLLQGLPPSEGDALAAALRQTLADRKRPAVVTRLRRSAAKPGDLPEALQLLQAVELLRDAGVVLEGWAADPDLPRKLARFAVQAEKAAASLQILPRKLFGRRRELEAFHEFARTRAVQSPPFVLANTVDPPVPTDPPTVILSGLGGSGKSTLLEALRRRLARDPSLLLVVFDLDQTSLRAGHPVALTQELLRQVGEARPELDPKMSALRQSLRGGVASATEARDVGRESSAVLSALVELNGILLAESGRAPISLVLVFDTFEEALILGEDRVRRIADWIAQVGSHWLYPRVILSGREADGPASAALPGLAVLGSIRLGDLGVQAGRALLRDRFTANGVDAEALVPQLVDALGSDPLTLMMLARFAASLGTSGKALHKDLIALAEDEGSDLREKLDAERRQTFLYTRILNRLPTQDLQALANPGLVLRQVTPELILDVLAEPCGLPPTLDAAGAERLFDRLAEMVWLVKPTATGARVVQHIPDLRRRMLPQLLQDPRAQKVLTAAVDWFGAKAASGDAEARREAMYYRALRDPGSLPSDPAVLRALADHLGPSVGDLGFAADQFRDAMGGVVSHAAIEGLRNAGVQRRAREKRRKYQMSEGLESAVVAEAAGAEPETGEAMPPDLVSARFAALEFATVAAEAPQLIRLLLDGLPRPLNSMIKTSAPTSDDLQVLSVAALQAATACLAPEVGPEARAALRGAMFDWLDSTDRGVSLIGSYANALLQSSQLWPAKLAAALALSLADDEALAMLGEPVATGVREMAKQSHSPYAWRSLRLVGPLAEDAEVKGIALAYLAPEVLPFVATSVTLTEAPGVAQSFKTILNSAGKVSISDHNRIDAALFREDVTLRAKLPMIGRLAETVPGRLPEFHGAFRSILGGGTLSPAMVQEAVSFVARSVPWWPKELEADAFGTAPFSPTLISSLIDTADRCGRLPDLAAMLARAKGAPEACGRLAALIETTVGHYRRAAGVPG